MAGDSSVEASGRIKMSLKNDMTLRKLVCIRVSKYINSGAPWETSPGAQHFSHRLQSNGSKQCHEVAQLNVDIPLHIYDVMNGIYKQ